MSNSEWGAIPRSLADDVSNVIEKKMGTSSGYKPSEWANEINLMGKLPVKTASGAIASFSDGADDVPISDCKFSFSPKQAQGTPSPSNPLAITGWSGLNIEHCGANIWDEQWETGTYDATTGEPGYSSTRIRSKVGNDIFVKGLTSLYVVAPENVRCIFLDDSGNVLGSPSAVRNDTVTVTTGAVWCRFYTASTYGGTYNNDISINSPNTATAYNAYHAETKAVTWTEQGTIYGGYVTPDKVVKTWVKKLGNELSWSRHSSGYFYAVTANTGKASGQQNVKSNVLQTTTTSAMTSTDYAISGRTQDGNIYVRLLGTETLTEFETWIADKEICYELATPIEYDITALNLATYYGDNNFWCDSGDSEIQYRADIALALNQ